MLATQVLPFFFTLAPCLGLLEPIPALAVRDHSLVPGGFVALRKGSLTLVTDLSIKEIRDEAGDLDMAWRGHVVANVLSEIELRWSGEGSVRAFGPASIEWVGSPFTGPPLDLIDFTRLELEIRSGELGARLPGGVLLVAERSAFELVRRSSGAFGIHHLGGKRAQVVIPQAGSPDARKLEPGAWIWIDPSDFSPESRFEFASGDMPATDALPQESAPSRFLPAEEKPKEKLPTVSGLPLVVFSSPVESAVPPAALMEPLDPKDLPAQLKAPFVPVAALPLDSLVPILSLPTPALLSRTAGKQDRLQSPASRPDSIDLPIPTRTPKMQPPKKLAAPLLPLTFSPRPGTISTVAPLLLLQEGPTSMLGIGPFQTFNKKRSPRQPSGLDLSTPVVSGGKPKR